MEKNKNGILIVLVVIIMILVGAVVYLELNTEPTLNDNVNDEILEEDIEDEEIIPELTVTLGKGYGIDYKDYNSDIVKTVEVDTITLDYDTEYVRLINEYYKKISEDALAGNVLFTQEYESFLDIYTLDNLRLKSELEINYYTYEDVLTIEAINHSIVTEGGGSYISYVTNINTTTGQEYSNIELLDLFNISLDEFFVKVQKLREENSSDTYIPTIDSASLSVISGKLHVNLAVGLEYGPVLLS